MVMNFIAMCIYELLSMLCVIFQDEFSAHETNQRMVMLYGFGKTRDDAKHAVKKVCKNMYLQSNIVLLVFAGIIRCTSDQFDSDRVIRGLLTLW